MAESPLSYFSTFILRQNLLGRNLPPYNVPGVYSGKNDRAAGDLFLRDSSVINTPDPLVNEPFLTDAYKRNEYGPNGGYDKDISFITDTEPTQPNQGAYGPTPPFLNAIVRYNFTFRAANAVRNKYAPIPSVDLTQSAQTSYTFVYDNSIDRTVIPLFENYWAPPSFVPSLYTPYNILLQGDPVGDDGLLSEDSETMKVSAKNLKDNLQYRVDQNVRNQTIGRLNILNGLKDPFNLAQILAGKRPLVARDWKITVSGGILGNGMDILQRFAGVTVPVSPIPGDYFDEDMEEKNYGSAFSQITAYRSGFVGKLLGRRTDRGRTPSELFLEYTGSGQKSQLQANIDMNRYRPNYQLTKGGNLVSRIVGAITSIFDSPAGSGEFYVGGTDRDPSTITSPPGQVPLNAVGKEVNAPVYGNDLLAKIFEGEDKDFKFGLAGKSFENDGGIQGGFTWVSPKYKKDAGNYVGPGGKVFGADPEFNEISNTLQATESTNYEFTPNSILFNTQKLIDSIPEGKARFAHVGNAIDQTSKVFNDGYRELTKGSQVISYISQNGVEVGQEYCRIFTKDTPYYTFTDLQKKEGITNYGRKFADSVLDNTFNLNIAPMKGTDSTNIVPNNNNGLGGYAKKYMFSIENLAWRTGSRPDYRVQDLPVCERGPNGGRVMWFPPYDLKFDESVTPSFKDHDFIGRPEPVYTYTNTKRTGTLSWKMLVDHPSVVNVLVNKVLASETDRAKVDSIINSFYAGCRKYDLYDLARQYNTIPTNELYTYQQILNNPALTNEQLSNISDNTNNQEQTTQQPTEVNLSKYQNLGFYFENDIPDPNTLQTYSTVPFQSVIDPYLQQKSFYVSQNVKNGTDVQTQIGNFFDDVISDNYNFSKELLKDVINAVTNKNQRVTIILQGSASAPQTKVYNDNLSLRRISSVQQYFTGYTFQSGEESISMGKLIAEGKVIIKSLAEGENATGIQPRSYNKNTTLGTYNCTDGDLATEQDLTVKWYGLNAMACRVVRIANISSEPLTTGNPPDITADQNRTLVAEGNTPQPQKPQPQVDLLQEVKQGISKKILRHLLSECDYFEVLKESNPFVYDSIKDKIKYFSPVFHSMTPEGLNSRLTFLQQCTRPGDTIPTIGANGEKIYNDAINTAFGAPPVLVLRIGDFYNTKIIPTSLTLKYENLDLNPEGIGVQPMIVDVTLGFNFIGGSGLKQPIERLQNALSFNFYANTEIYDERATPTVDTSALDKALVQAIIDQTPVVGINNVSNVQENDFGKTIGDIATRIQTETAETGTTNYNVFMNKLRTETKTYYDSVSKFIEEVLGEYNLAVYQATVDTMNYTSGSTRAFTTPLSSPLFGKPADYQKNIDAVFGEFIKDIDAETIPFLSGSTSPGKKATNKASVRSFKKNYTTFVNDLRNEFMGKLTESIQNVTTVQQSLTYLIDCSNLVDSKTDAYIMTDGNPKIFNISGTTIVTGKTESATADTYVTLVSNITTLSNLNVQFINILTQSSKNLLYNVNYDEKKPGNFVPVKTSNENDMNTIQKRREYFIMCQTVLKQYQTFETSMLKDINDKQFEDAFKSFYGTDTKAEFQRQQDAANQLLAEFKVSGATNYFAGYNPFPEDIKRPFTFSTLPIPTDAQKKNVKNLYTTQNVDNGTKVYNLKKKFN